MRVTGRRSLQVARSFVPGALSGWVLYNKSIPLAPLELTVEVPERVGARGEVVEPLDEEAARKALRRLYARGVEALTISLFNAYANSVHERRLREIAQEEVPAVSGRCSGSTAGPQQARNHRSPPASAPACRSCAGDPGPGSLVPPRTRRSRSLVLPWTRRSRRR